MEQVEREILVPIVHALKRARRPFRGVLYAGLMLTNQGPKVLEFNVRFGDPECQAVLMRLKSDLFEALEAVVDERLDTDHAGVGPAPGGDRGHGLRGLSRPLRTRPGDQQPRGSRADARRQGLPRRDRAADRPASLGRDGRIVTDGGRVLDVTALGATLADAQTRVYEAVRCDPLHRRLVSPRHRRSRPPRRR